MTTSTRRNEHRLSPHFSNQQSQAALSGPSGDRQPWTILVVLAIAQFMVVLDITIVNVALPSIGRSLNFARTDLQWVVTAYALCTGGLVLVGGRASDLFGRRRVFIAGLVVFALASAGSGLAPSSGALILARVAQGIGAAAMSPAALSIITTSYAGAQRATALSVWGAISSGAVAVGVIAGGALVTFLSWHWVFLINVPVGLVGAVAAAQVLPAGKRASGSRRLDPAGVLAAVGGFATIVYGLSGAPAHGWTSGRTIALLAAGLALLGVFALIERFVRAPLVTPTIWRERALISSAAMILGIMSILVGAFFLLSVYTQDVLRWSALHTGAGLLPFVAAIAFGVHLTGHLIGKLGSRPLIMAGMALTATGALLFSLGPDHASYASNLLPGLVVLGLGIGIAFPATSITAMSNVSEGIAGLASGLTSTAHELGAAIGVAALAAIAAGGSTVAQGTHTAFTAAAIGGVLLVVLAAAAVPSVRPEPGKIIAIH